MLTAGVFDVYLELALQIALSSKFFFCSCKLTADDLVFYFKLDEPILSAFFIIRSSMLTAGAFGLYFGRGCFCAVKAGKTYVYLCRKYSRC